MRKLLVTAVACTALFAQTSAQAANGCLGCNVADEHVLNSSLVGTTVYFDGTRGIADAIDRDAEKVYVRLTDGRYGWAPARQTYTSASFSERQTVGAGAVVVGILGLLMAASGSGSSNSSRSSSSSGNSYHEVQHYRYDPVQPSYQSAAPAPPPPQTSGFYGNCHGGAAYGC